MTGVVEGRPHRKATPLTCLAKSVHACSRISLAESVIWTYITHEQTISTDVSKGNLFRTGKMRCGSGQNADTGLSRCGRSVCDQDPVRIDNAATSAIS